MSMLTKLNQRLRRWEKVFYIVILVLALASRFYMLGERAISHDESIHTKFSWNLYSGSGFQHNPMMHGPLLFEVTALIYFLFGVSDFTSRIYPSLVGVLLVLSPLLFRKWIGKRGAAIASVMLLISPSISYYSRYIRHDAPVMLFAVLWLWTIFKYLEDGRHKWLYWLAAFFALTYATKEVAYIYTAIFAVLLFIPFAWQVIRIKWARVDMFQYFLLALGLVLVMGLVFGISFMGAQVEEKNLDEAGNTRVANVSIPWWGRGAAALAFVTLIGAVVLVYYGVGEARMAQVRLFDLLMVIGTLTLPLGSAFLIKFVAGVDMGVFYDALMNGNLGSLPTGSLVSALLVVGMSLVGSALLGLWWNTEHWPTMGLIHYAIFFVLYTTFFTNGLGALSGLVGGLAYWMAQQGVERGSQPWYYYLFIGSLYEYLPLLFSVGGGLAVLAQWVPSVAVKSAKSADQHNEVPALNLERLFPLFLLGWTVMAWIAYTYAGEKMPWLLVHIVLPSSFLAAWGLAHMLSDLHLPTFLSPSLSSDPLIAEAGPIEDLSAVSDEISQTVEHTPHSLLFLPPGITFLITIPLLLTAWVVLGRSTNALVTALAPGISEAGPTIAQLEPLGRGIGALVGVMAFSALLVWSWWRIGTRRALQSCVLVAAIFLSAITLRAAMMFNFSTYDLATEFLVYAHATPDIKIALRQVEDISWRTTGAPRDVKVAYGEDGSWPLTWYMTDYPNAYFYSTTPDHDTLLECPVVIAGSPQYSAVEEILGNDYMHFEYKYLWWPIQDYFDLNWGRIRNIFSDTELQAALWDIFWDRDYTRYARLKSPEAPFTLQKWPHRKEFRLYVRLDLAQDVWSYQLGPRGQQVVRPQETQVPDPYDAGLRALT
ncbi:MAG: TIGR03663 family protein, partial [Anaerolineae bacterium]|nr:TIGR03663 family protein [Anaerolineae bacterium]